MQWAAFRINNLSASVHHSLPTLFWWTHLLLNHELYFTEDTPLHFFLFNIFPISIECSIKQNWNRIPIQFSISTMNWWIRTIDIFSLFKEFDNFPWSWHLKRDILFYGKTLLVASVSGILRASQSQANSCQLWFEQPMAYNDHSIVLLVYDDHIIDN